MSGFACSYLIINLLVASTTWGQNPCSTPTLHLANGKQQLASNGGPFVPQMTMTLVDSSACATQRNYRVTAATLTLVRQQRPVRVIRVYKPTAILSDWQELYQPNDQIHIEIDGAQLVLAGNKVAPAQITSRLIWLITK